MGKMRADEIDIDATLVRRLLADQFPKWADLPIGAVRSTGTVNAIYRLGDHLCVRLPRVEGWARDLEKELRWLPTLALHLPLRIPEPVGQGPSYEIVPLLVGALPMDRRPTVLGTSLSTTNGRRPGISRASWPSCAV